jgi:hypothetical protein
MSRRADHDRQIQGRRGSRIDFQEGGRYLSIPQNRAFTFPQTSHPGVQGTGCGTTAFRTDGTISSASQ